MVTPETSTVREPAGGGAATPAPISAPRRFGWLLRRELWESRSLYLAPRAVAGLALLAGVISALRHQEQVSAALAAAPAQRHAAITEPYVMVSLLLMATTFFVGVFYSIDSLQSERRDRSILFWKSLPVSDLSTVLAKAVFPILVLPLLTVVLAVGVHLIMLLVASASLLARGQDVGPLWAQVNLVEMEAMLAYHMVAIHGLWYAPFYGWLLLVSAWARRAAWLWAILPPLAIGLVERIAFGTSVFADALLQRLAGAPAGTEYTTASGMMDPLMAMTPAKFLASPGLWLGLLATAGLLAAAVRLRRLRGPV
jgi:ABC-2 type transport system permease protein